MASNISDYAANKLLDHLLGKASFTMPTGVWLALYTVAPTSAGGGTEVSGTNYSRMQVNASDLAAASSRAITNTAAFTFPTAGSGGWGTIVALALKDASTGGNQLGWGDATANKTIASGDIYIVPIGELDVTL